MQPGPDGVKCRNSAEWEGHARFAVPPALQTLFVALLWQACVMSKGFRAASGPISNSPNNAPIDRTGQVTVHPELLDSEGRITEEALLTVRSAVTMTKPQRPTAPARINWALGVDGVAWWIKERIVAAVIKGLKLPPVSASLMKEDPVRLELNDPAYGKTPSPWDWWNPSIWWPGVTGKGGSPVICRAHGTGPCATARSAPAAEPYLKEALQTMFETGLPAIVFEELTGEEYHPVDGTRHVR